MPAWSALIVQVPAPTNETVDPLTAQTLGVALVNVTALPDAPPVAVTLYVDPPTFAFDGAVEVKAIACAPWPTE